MNILFQLVHHQPLLYQLQPVIYRIIFSTHILNHFVYAVTHTIKKGKYNHTTAQY